MPAPAYRKIVKQGLTVNSQPRHSEPRLVSMQRLGRRGVAISGDTNKTERPAFGAGLVSVGGGIQPQDSLSSPQQINAE